MSNAVTQGSQVPASRSDTLLNFIERASRDEAFDLAKFEALLRMQREVVADQAKREFNEAMASAQSEMEPVIRDAKNTNTNSKYARLETIDAQMRPIYTRHGFSVRYGSEQHPREGWLRIKCTVAHSGGYFEEHHLDAALDSSGLAGKTNKTQVQAVGSTVTYLRRYLLSMVFNIVVADEDNDGNAVRGSSSERVAPVDMRSRATVSEQVKRAEDIMTNGSGPPKGQPRETANWIGDDLPADMTGRDYPPPTPSLEDRVDHAIQVFASCMTHAHRQKAEQKVRDLLFELDQVQRQDLRDKLVDTMNFTMQRITKREAETLEAALPPVAADAGK